MLQLEKPEDFVIATGKSHSVREFVEESFKIVGKEIVWEGKGVNEIGREKESGVIRVKVNPKYYRPTEVVSLESTIIISKYLTCLTNYIKNINISACLGFPSWRRNKGKESFGMVSKSGLLGKKYFQTMYRSFFKLSFFD